MLTARRPALMLCCHEAERMVPLRFRTGFLTVAPSCKAPNKCLDIYHFTIGTIKQVTDTHKGLFMSAIGCITCSNVCNHVNITCRPKFICTLRFVLQMYYRVGQTATELAYDLNLI